MEKGVAGDEESTNAMRQTKAATPSHLSFFKWHGWIHASD